MEHSVLNDILILLTVAIVVVTVFRRLGLPAILGYLCVGLIAGPYGFGWLVFDDVILFLGELGIVFLLCSTLGIVISNMEKKGEHPKAIDYKAVDTSTTVGFNLASLVIVLMLAALYIVWW